ncbi:MAG: hypothetical protein J6Y77_04695, partial [Paludibacteraceae bacterium]|nr:hypothetical protein [Paludibacteraceae bacterium]
MRIIGGLTDLTSQLLVAKHKLQQVVYHVFHTSKVAIPPAIWCKPTDFFAKILSTIFLYDKKHYLCTAFLERW